MISRAGQCLEEEGYSVSRGGGCFDILAKKDCSIALKALINVDSFTRSEAEDLKTLTAFLGTFPVLVGERANRYVLEQSIVYERFGIAAMSSFTFKSFVKGIKPTVKSRRGGFVVSMDEERLKTYMNEKGMSVAELSSISGISRKTLYKCGRGETVDVGTCGMIEKIMGAALGGGIDVEGEYCAAKTEPRSSFKRMVSAHLGRMGFIFSFLSRSPFNLLMKDEETLVSVVSQDRKRFAAHAGILHDLEREFDIESVFITNYGHAKNVDGIPVISLREVKEMESPREFIENMEERRD
jgi:putative transcriptional regulator